MRSGTSANGKLRLARRAKPQRVGRAESAGARNWYFPDGYLPAKQSGAAVEAHEALMILNVGPRPARMRFDFYFEDREPITDVAIELGARRVKCYRLDRPREIGGVELPVTTQYAVRVRSNVPVIVQLGR